jgi:basic membrane lipoprotein Med (substrate-binding protein (PBP1-ABC) superfamily)
MKQEAVLQYNAALKAGQKYYKNAAARGQYPYPLVLQDMLQESAVAGYADLGILEVPVDAVVGTRYAGRREALAGNFMPLLDSGSEFAAKWMRLCDAHLGDEGIRDPIECFEYLGRFYIQEGNKRFSVLKSFEALTVPAHVTRIIPTYTEDPAIRIYYEFMHFYALSGLYGVEFRRPGCYAKLQAALGYEPEHVWTENERRSFSSAFLRFQSALEKYRPERLPVTPAEILLVWLQLFPLSDIRDLGTQELTARIGKLLPDALAQQGDHGIELLTEPSEEGQNVLTGLLNAVLPHHLNVAFLYTAAPEESTWVRAHDDGRKSLEERFGEQLTVSIWYRAGREDEEVLDAAIAAGAEVVFATDASMLGACRKAAALHPNIRFLCCAVFQPYTGVRMYNGRTYECKFITGAIAGAMARDDRIGYVANYPIMGVTAAINAFALGARMTNPRAKIVLKWSCLPGNPILEYKNEGISVISNRDEDGSNSYLAWDLGTYMVKPQGGLQSLASPRWNWGSYYEKTVQSLLNGGVEALRDSKHAVNDWWGLSTGVVNVEIDESLPEGVKLLARILKNGIVDEEIDPFLTVIRDQKGRPVSDGTRSFSPEELMRMDWLNDNIEGSIPGFDELLPRSQNLVRLLGIYRQFIPPKTEEASL